MNERAVKEPGTIGQRFGYAFKEPALLEEALRHSSFVNETADPDLRDNERLEFLGDAVLDLAISHILMELFPDAREGDLSRYRASMVDEKGLCQVALELGLGEFILLGKGEESSGGRRKPSILANTLEALIGALYLDAGYSRTQDILQAWFLPSLEKIGRDTGLSDHKSLLQEFTQQRYRTRPGYSLLEENGPAHDKVFKVALQLNGEVIAVGAGKSKKQAEQRAAREALLCLREKENEP